MTDTYPEIIRQYFSAVDRRDLDALTESFTDDASVTDDGRTYHGRGEIRGWREATGVAYEYVVEVLDAQRTGDHTYLVDTNVFSSTSGTTIELKFRFTLQGRLIKDLQISA